MVWVKKVPIFALTFLMKVLCVTRISQKTWRSWVLKLKPIKLTHVLKMKFKCQGIQPYTKAATDFWNFDHFGVLHGPKWGAKSKFWSNNISGHGKVSIYWVFENPSSETEGEVLFSNIGPFRAFWGHSPKTGPKIKISAQQVFLA